MTTSVKVAERKKKGVEKRKEKGDKIRGGIQEETLLERVEEGEMKGCGRDDCGERMNGSEAIKKQCDVKFT